jgi:hypothetical protein
VADSDRLVPVRVDRRSGALDLMKIRRSRLTRTPSGK